jgi:hypothetical protein
MKEIGQIVVIMAFGIPANLLRCWVVAVMWDWFVVTRFHAPSPGHGRVGVFVWMGLLTMLTMIGLDPQWTEVKGMDDEPVWLQSISRSLRIAIFSLLALAFGWIYLQFA